LPQNNQIDLPESLQGLVLTDGIYTVRFTRPWYSFSEPVIGQDQIGQVFTNGSVQWKVIRAAYIDSNTIEIDLLLITSPVPLVTWLVWLAAAGVITAMFSWACNSVVKVADATSTTEIIGYDPNGNPITSRRSIFADIADVAKFLVLGAIVWFTVKAVKKT